MNVHFLIVLAEFLAICGIAMLTMLLLALPVRAHSRSRGSESLSPSPFATAEYLQRAGRLQAAIAEYERVRESAAYRDTPFAPEAVYRMARLYRDGLHDENAAMRMYETLLFTYPTTAYAHKAGIRTERAALGHLIDLRNSHQVLYRLIAFFVRLAGSGARSYPFALFLLSLAARMFLLPLTIRQHQEARRMQRLKPHVDALRDEYKDQPAMMNEHIMALYKREGVHPLLGIGLALAQGAVFLVLYQAILLYKYHFVGGTFLWIQSVYALTHPGVIAFDLSEPDLLLLLIYGASMFATTLLASPQTSMTTGATSASRMALSTVVTTTLFIAWTWTNHTPAAFVLYWLISSLFGSMTQLLLQKMMPMPAVS